MAKIQLLIFSMVLGLCASCSSSNTNPQTTAETAQDMETRQNNDNSAIDKALLSEKDIRHACLKDFDSPFDYAMNLYPEFE